MLTRPPWRGAAIDAHDVVLRFNQAPIESYSKQVGTKTTFRLTNKVRVYDSVSRYVLWSRAYGHGQGGSWVGLSDECKGAVEGTSTKRPMGLSSKQPSQGG